MYLVREKVPVGLSRNLLVGTQEVLNGMTYHTIIVEYRPPNARERRLKLYGEAVTIDSTTRVFIRKGQSRKEMINTFFHELAHAFNHFHGFRTGQDGQEEKLCRLVGDVVEPCYRRYTGIRSKGRWF
jgi:hypothetical protein